MAELARRFQAPAGSYFWLAGKLETFALKRTDGVFCNSAYTEGLVRPRARKTWRVPNALRAEFFSPERQPPAPRCQLLNIGVITRAQAAVGTARCGGAAPRRRGGFSFPVCRRRAGGGQLRAGLSGKNPASGGGGGCQPFRPLPTAELVAECDRSHALVHFPSEEAFGLVVAESLARGCKFFGARAGGIVDITAGVAGTELYDVNDWTGRWLASRPGCATALGVRRTARGRYGRHSPAVVAQRHLEIYREVLDRKND